MSIAAMTALRINQVFKNDRALCEALNKALNLRPRIPTIEMICEPNTFSSSAPIRSFHPHLVTEADEIWERLTESTLGVL